MSLIHARIWHQVALVDIRAGYSVSSPSLRALALVARLCVDTFSIYWVTSAIVCLTFIDIKTSLTIA